MHQVSLSDPLYAEATRAAAASGLTLEAFVEEAVQLRVQDEGLLIVLTSEQREIVDRAEREIDAGNGLSSDQVRKHFAKKRFAVAMQSA